MGHNATAPRRGSNGRLPSDHWAAYIRTLDPEIDHVEIQRKVAMHEFPWDMTQALSFALFRTYAVPGIGRLLYETGQFTENTQKRYDDTTLLLEPPARYGFEDPKARAAIRRINQMHRAHDIPDHEMRYVLATFVVVPKRWMEVYGKRPLTAREVKATVHYYRDLGHRMGIREIPENYVEFERFMDSYEAEHFAHDAGGRAVADATLDLLTTFYPRPLRGAVRLFSLALMDEPLLDALGYRRPPRPVVAVSRAALRARGRLLRHAPARKEPFSVEQSPNVKGYPGGYRVEDLGTFAGTFTAPATAPATAPRQAGQASPAVPGCPVSVVASSPSSPSSAS